MSEITVRALTEDEWETYRLDGPALGQVLGNAGPRLEDRGRARARNKRRAGKEVLGVDRDVHRGLLSG